MNKIFIKRLTTRGNLSANYVFSSDKEVNDWLSNDLLLLEKEHGKLTYTITELDGLKVGDTCKVTGEGDEDFVIEKLIRYSKDRYGFVLDSGWTEEVAKCYK